MNSFFHKLRWLRRRADKEAELREELQFHLEQDAEQRRDDGLTEREARWAARRELGNVALVQEGTRAAWGWARLEQFARDAGYGWRQVRRNPLFSGIAIATLALGIGGVTAMFSAFDAVLIRPHALCRRGPSGDDLGLHGQERRHDETQSHTGGVDRVAAPQFRIHRPRVQPAGRRDTVRRRRA